MRLVITTEDAEDAEVTIANVQWYSAGMESIL